MDYEYACLIFEEILTSVRAQYRILPTTVPLPALADDTLGQRITARIMPILDYLIRAGWEILFVSSEGKYHQYNLRRVQPSSATFQ